MIFVASGTQDGRGLVEYLLKQNYKVMASVVTNYGKELLPKDSALCFSLLLLLFRKRKKKIRIKTSNP